MDRLFFLSWEGLWFFLTLLAGHAVGYPLVIFTRRRGYNDFVAVFLSCLLLVVVGLADVFLDVWYVHPAGFGVLMGTIAFLASTAGQTPAEETVSDKTWPDIIVFGASWCGDCRRTQQLLDANSVPYTYHDIEEENLGDLVIQMNEEAGFGPRRRIPTVKVDGKTLSVPSNAELSELLGL